MTAGNGGLGGGINWPDMGSFTHYGFAAIATDTGHSSNQYDGTWALNHPESIIDWGYRAMHGSVVLGKQIIEAYYGYSENNATGLIKYNYYASCSTGGRQGLKEIQQYPEDFDGIAVGAPAWWTTHMGAWMEHLGILNLPLTNNPSHIPPALFKAYIEEVTRQCDLQDGVLDGIVSDPYGCHFRAEALLCKNGDPDHSSCFTREQLSTLRHILSDWIETNDTFVFPGLTLGADPTALAGMGEPSPLGQQLIENFYLNVTNYDYTTFDFATVQLILELDTGRATADKYDLSAFNAKNGKVIMYHGLSDQIITTGSSTYYYEQVQASMRVQGVNVDDFYRLFLVPGMHHCSNSNTAPWYFAGAKQVPNVRDVKYSVPGYEDAQHDVLLALMQWVEHGVAPDSIIATRFIQNNANLGVDKQRPLCVYPKQARYHGGDPDMARSWACESLD